MRRKVNPNLVVFKPKVKKPKKIKESQLDKLWAEFIKKRAGNKCEYCGKEAYLNSHHVFSRSSRSVRWEPENGICLCAGHHTFELPPGFAPRVKW